jgi:hypothetical protein
MKGGYTDPLAPRSGEGGREVLRQPPGDGEESTEGQLRIQHLCGVISYLPVQSLTNHYSINPCSNALAPPLGDALNRLTTCLLVYHVSGHVVIW